VIGNDVVDLDDPAIVDHHLRPRFLARVLAEGERARVAASPEPKRLLWSLFAAKEAAFKTVQKLRGPTVFAHRGFVVSADGAAVSYDDLSLPLVWTFGNGWVHAVVSTERGAPVAAVERLPDGEDPSVAARALLRRTLAPALACGPDDLEVVRDPAPGSWTGQGPPRLLLKGAPLDLDLSLSHDGRFVAFASSAPRARGRFHDA
jgi:phosphopantetheinyl transferase (holo-ACP synthase)